MRMLTVSLKENIEMVKEELNSEEQFFEKAVQTERFVKKYKTPLIAIITATVLAVVTATAYNVYTQNKIEASNTALNVLLQNPADVAAKDELKNLNPKLYDVWTLSNALKTKDKAALNSLQNSKALVVADLAQYELAAMDNDEKALASYSQKNGALLKDLAVIEAAVLLMEKGEKDAAHNKLAMISLNSPVYKLAQSLSHYGIK